MNVNSTVLAFGIVFQKNQYFKNYKNIFEII